ncbi:MAG: hypothetical protein EOO28_02640 [Comamonadaceae bacterium]|nr:MAG: hypothetical protein EOO28_02640 [Comamonadaceae bacterium]
MKTGKCISRPSGIARLKTVAVMFGLASVLAACGGGGGSVAASGTATAPPTTVVSGNAAVGSPLVNAAVQLRCDASASAAATTDANGAWSASVNTAVMPCAIRVSGGTIGAGGPVNVNTFFSVAGGTGTSVIANITPLTTLALTKANNGPITDAGFAALANTTVARFVTDAQAQATALATTLAAQGYTVPGSFNPFTTPFSPQRGNVYDDLLEQIRTTLANAASTYGQIFASYANSATLPVRTDAAPTGPTTGGPTTGNSPGAQTGGITFATTGGSRTADDIALLVGTYQGIASRTTLGSSVTDAASCTITVAADGGVVVASPTQSYSGTVNGELGDAITAIPSANTVQVLASSTAVADQSTGTSVQVTVVRGYVTKATGMRGYLYDQHVECYVGNPHLSTVGTTTTAVVTGATAQDIDSSWVGTFSNGSCTVTSSNTGVLTLRSGSLDTTSTLGGDAADGIFIYPTLDTTLIQTGEWGADGRAFGIGLSRAGNVYQASAPGLGTGQCMGMTRQ